MTLSDELRARYARQILLPELGPGGQARIVAGCAAVAGQPGGSSPTQQLTHQVAERYARCAGFERVSAAALDLEAMAPRDVVSHDAPRAVLAGARAALAAIRRAAATSPVEE
jgi:hypothetical protein